MTRDEKLASVFDALAHPRRMHIFRLLIEKPEVGRTLDGLQKATEYKETPLLHHLTVMERAGLIRKRRVGTYVARVVTPGPLTDALAQVSRLAGAAGKSWRSAG